MYCTHCGKQIPDQSKFCRYCGSRLSAPAEPQVQVSPPPTRKKGRTAGIIIGIVAILILIPAVLFAVLHFRSDGTGRKDRDRRETVSESRRSPRDRDREDDSSAEPGGFSFFPGRSSSAAATMETAPPAAEAAAGPAGAFYAGTLGDPASYLDPSFIDPLNGWAEYDILIDEIRSVTDYVDRTALMHQAEDILMATGCVVPIYYYNDVYLQKPYLSGAYSDPYGFKHFMYASLDNGENVLRLSLSDEYPEPDPAMAASTDSQCLVVNSFSGLYAYSADGRCVPACAEGYSVSSDCRTYTVRLKEGLKWSDGSALTAADFAYAWKRTAATETSAIFSYMYSGFEGYPDDLNVAAIDDSTLVFTMADPCPYIEDLLSYPAFFPVKQAAVEASPGWKTDPGAWSRNAGYVCNGPFICTSWNPGVSMTFEKNPYWYDAGSVGLDMLEITIISDASASYDMYQAGALDFLNSVPADRFAALSGDPELHIVDELGTNYLAFNAKSSLFAGKTPEEAACMRMAMSLLIDRDYICRNITQTGQLPASSLIPVGMADGSGGIFHSDLSAGYYDAYGINNDYDGTVAMARALLEAAGYRFDGSGVLSAETPIRMEFLTSQSSGYVAIAESVQADLSVLGIEVDITTVDSFSDFVTLRGNGSFDIVRDGWIADYNDPINMLEIFTTDSSHNDCQFGP